MGAAVFGRSTGTPTVISGAETMKTISSTSMTSTKGVTLISDSWLYERRLPRRWTYRRAGRPSGQPRSSS